MIASGARSRLTTRCSSWLECASEMPWPWEPLSGFTITALLLENASLQTASRPAAGSRQLRGQKVTPWSCRASPRLTLPQTSCIPGRCDSHSPSRSFFKRSATSSLNKTQTTNPPCPFVTCQPSSSAARSSKSLFFRAFATSSRGPLADLGVSPAAIRALLLRRTPLVGTSKHVPNRAPFKIERRNSSPLLELSITSLRGREAQLSLREREVQFECNS
mmetsp:Transcript_11480/g.20300  ORF Transcript_11480/g.20300 Transcript_11480/m.20300 type:complete len:218 (+) Transcript_11480:854-1507(+)